MRRLLLAALLSGAALACDANESPTDPGLEIPPDAPASRALGLWEPYGPDTCTPAIHESYAVVGPDGKVYPTWHPPVDPATGCTFGHEHGRDPRGSDLYDEVGPIPFGYANEHLVESGFSAPRATRTTWATRWSGPTTCPCAWATAVRRSSASPATS